VTPLITAFQASYPNVRVQVLVTERIVDLIAEGVDLAFRLGELKDSSLVARKILTYRHQLVASPSYLKTSNAPRHPQDLLEHRLLTFSYWRPEWSWTFIHKNGKDSETLTFQPHFSMNDFAGLAPALAAASATFRRSSSPVSCGKANSSRSAPTGVSARSICRSFTWGAGICRSRAGYSRNLRRR